MPMPEVEAVIFDLGRVMVTIDPLRPGFAALMHAIGVRPEDAFRRFWREPAVLAHNTGAMSPTRFYHVVRDQFALDWSEEEFRAAWCDLFAPMPGMEALFRRVAARQTVGVLSDTDPLH